jgi:hypothetical protein
VAKKRPSDRKLAADERVPIPAHLRPRPAIHYELDEKPERGVLWVLRSLTPGLNYLTKRYSRRWLRADSIAGVAVAAYLIPQVMAYSAIVNVPPVASLWAALAAIVAIDVIGKEMLFATLPVAEESYLRWALEPAQPTETLVQAIEDEPAGSSLPWHRPESDDEPAEGRDPDRGH